MKTIGERKNSILKRNPGQLPGHLPKKLSITFFYSNWLCSVPGSPFADIENCFRGMKERGFNTARVGVGLNYIFTPNGNPRGKMEFEWGTNCSINHSIERIDVMERLIHLLELARRHKVWIILTSWEYQDSSCVSDPTVRAEMSSIPHENRFMHLAEHHDRLLAILKDKQLAENVAFVEIHNEPEYSDFPQGAASKGLHEQAIAMLRERHPDILFSADFASHNYSIVPDNAQVFDQHIYAGSGWHTNLYDQTVNNEQVDPQNPRAFEPLRRVLKEKDVISWDEFMAANWKMGRDDKVASEKWRRMGWMFANLDIARWDDFMAESFKEWKSIIWEKALKIFDEDAREGKRRGLPMVLDEGGYFNPPPQSQWELTPDGLSLLELFADLAIKYDYWGFMPGTYSGPRHILWREKPEWLKQINERFQSGDIGRQK